MSNKLRIEKLQELIKQETGKMLLNDIKDPRIGFVTVTDVEMTGDLREAKIFVSVMGGDAGESTLYSYVKINGELAATQQTQITSWNNWFTPEISGIEVHPGDTVTVGIHVECAAGGAWGKIDDAMLNSME